MLGRSSLGLLGLSGTALLLGTLGACAAPVDEPARGTTSSVSERSFDRNAVIDDRSMLDAEAMTVADVQKFLDKTPWGTRSALATYTENGKSAATIMVEAAATYGINPIEMLVRVQMEQGLISKTTATASAITIAFGCACPHSSICSDKYRGFANQADCAAGTLSRSMARALTTKGTASGWARNRSKATEDGLTIVPKNAATAALYTYTPWVGEAGGGREGIGGASLHAAVWDRFAESVSYGEWATQAAGDGEEADAGAATPDSGTPVEASDAGNGGPTETDAGTATPDSGTTDTDAGAPDAGEPANEEPQGAPADGSEDDAILSEGNAPPTTNAAPPKAKGKAPAKPEELPEASEDELASKSKAGAGCSTSGRGGDATNGLLLAGAIALVASRRRRAR
jgi:hypothetical protein